MIALTVATLLVGISLGLLGGGGSILMVPLLAYGAGLPAREAIATSLLVVGATSAVAMVGHARERRVDWRVGGLFGLASMGGAFVGGKIAHRLPASALLAAFTVVMFVTAFAMMRKRPATPSEARAASPTVAAGVGVFAGLLAGLVGAGGGFVIVPALVLFAGLPVRTAVGTSLLVITMSSFAGFASAVGSVSIDWHLAQPLLVAAPVGGALGVILSARVSPEGLRKGFAWLVLAVATFTAAKQIPRGLWGLLSGHALPAAALALAAGLVLLGASRVVRSAA